MLTSFERMKPDARLPIYQTKVSTIPLYWCSAPETGRMVELGELSYIVVTAQE